MVITRVDSPESRQANIAFLNFPGGSFSTVVAIGSALTINTPDGFPIKTFIGGRDDAFFNDLPGFFRSINYAPQFYHVPHTLTAVRELKIPKTLLELEGNHLFNFDPANPRLGRGIKKDLPPGPLTWNGGKFLKDEHGNFRFVYSGEDAQAGKNIDAIILEIPIEFITRSPAEDRIVNIWGESWVLKAAFPRVRKTLFQALNMPDDTWNKKGLKIPLRRPFEIFVPNVCAVDMDTTGTWPFGRRPEDQVATRFLSMFLDMEAEFKGKKYNVETLSDRSLWDQAPITPKTPPNPLKNDKEFLDHFPYLAEPW